MKKHFVYPLAGCLIVVFCAIGGLWVEAAPQAATGSIKGRIRLTGKDPGNAVIRMGVDPMCSQLNAGKRVLQEIVATSPDGGLANVFVKLQGTFPKTPVPAAPVTIDQRSCIYGPRVVGAMVGQTLQVRNSDPFLHNVHSISVHNNSFNVGQATAGLVYKFQLKDEELMLRLKCDVHRWMTAYIGVVTNPYFAVSGSGGTFQIDKVPVGTYTIESWHEQYGILKQTVSVKAGAATTVDFSYKGTEKPAAQAVLDITIPADALAFTSAK